jgi:uncharacterized repeat protein (TIGR01451 family)/CSLREA domain-containing protein
MMRTGVVGVPRRLTLRVAGPGLAVALVMLVSASAARAATFTVTSVTDTVNGSCAATCSLRDAIVAADAAGGSSTITVPAGTYTLSIPSTGTNDPATGDLDIDNNASVTVTGAGAGTTIVNANHVDRAFRVAQGASLTISGVTLEKGDQAKSTVTVGVASSNSSSPGEGGAIYNDGAVSINNSVLTANTGDDGGGAIFSDANATSTSITNSVVSANSSHDNQGGALEVTSGSVTFSGDTFQNNWAYDDGGVLYDDESGNTVGPLSVTNSSFSGNGADDPGGALFLAQSGATTISSSSFSDNSADDDQGGAIYADATGFLSVTGSSFTGNNAGGSGTGVDADTGGAIDTNSSDLSVSSSQFSGNSAQNGGALYIDGTAATAAESITGSSFTGNIAGYYEGGAVYDAAGALTVTATTMSENVAYTGGGLYYASGDALTLKNDTLDSNQAESGGGLYLSEAATSGSIALLNDTIAHNTAYNGGGINAAQDANSIENTIVADNTGTLSTPSTEGGDCYDTTALGTSDKGHNLDSDGSCFGGDSLALDDRKADPLLGTLAGNGGANQTDALKAGSPAIGGAAGVDCPTTDERGVARSAGACDIGAYQTAPADLAVTASGTTAVGVGAVLTDTFTVSNVGGAPATGVTFTDALPAGTTYFGSSASRGACSGTTTVTCSLGSIDSSHTGAVNMATVTIMFVPNAAGSVVNTGAVTEAETEATPANNHASVTATVTVTASITKTTVFVPPVVLTGTASEMTSTKATLSGLLNPAGEETTYKFQYGTSKHYGKTTKAGTIAAGVGQHGLTVKLTGLKAGTKYHFRLTASNAAGSGNGQDMTFKTKKATKHKKKRRA